MQEFFIITLKLSRNERLALAVGPYTWTVGAHNGDSEKR
jgi:hypothetical protein